MPFADVRKVSSAFDGAGKGEGGRGWVSCPPPFTVRHLAHDEATGKVGTIPTTLANYAPTRAKTAVEPRAAGAARERRALRDVGVNARVSVQTTSPTSRVTDEQSTIITGTRHELRYRRFVPIDRWHRYVACKAFIPN